MTLKEHILRFLHVLGIAGLGLATILLVWVHVMIGLFGCFYAIENIKAVIYVEVALSFYVFGYYVWLLRNHFMHNPPWQQEEESEE